MTTFLKSFTYLRPAISLTGMSYPWSPIPVFAHVGAIVAALTVRPRPFGSESALICWTRRFQNRLCLIHFFMSISIPAPGARTTGHSGNSMQQRSMPDLAIRSSAQIQKKKKESQQAWSSTEGWNENMPSSAAAAEKFSDMPA